MHKLYRGSIWASMYIYIYVYTDNGSPFCQLISSERWHSIVSHEVLLIADTDASVSSVELNDLDRNRNDAAMPFVCFSFV